MARFATGMPATVRHLRCQPAGPVLPVRMRFRGAPLEARAVLLVGRAVAVALALAGCAREAAPVRAPAVAVGPARQVRLPSGDPRVVFGAAVHATERGDTDTARGLFRSLLGAYPALEDYQLAYLAALEEEGDRPTEAAALDDRLLAEHPESIWVPLALARRARVALALGDPRASSFAARALAAAGTDASARALALLTEADLRVATAPREAYTLYQEARRGPAEPAALARVRSEDLERARPELLREPELVLAEGRTLVAEGRLDLAATRLEQAAASAPVEVRRDALRALARVRQMQGRADDALAAHRSAAVLEEPPGPAAFELATFLWNRDRDDEARAVFAAVLRAPGHPKRDAARYALARIAEREGRDAEALADYQQLVATGTDAELVREARWRLAWIAYQAGRLATAAEELAAMADASPPDRPAALYWQGRIREREADPAAAATLYAEVLASAPDSYYAELSEQRLGQSAPREAAPELLPAHPPPAITARAYHWTRSQELHAAGLDRLAARELDALARELAEAGATEPYVLEAYRTVDAHTRALRLAAELDRTAALPSSVLAAYLYPQAYWALVTEAAGAQRLDPYLVLALMRQESRFDPDAVSPAAAYGLMQLLEHTAEDVADRPVTAADLREAATNIRLGTRYLRRLVDRYAGDLAKTLAAYNAGEGAVARWEQRMPGAASDEFVESISFRETRRYVKAVLANYRRYRRLYGEARALGGPRRDGAPSPAGGFLLIAEPSSPAS